MKLNQKKTNKNKKKFFSNKKSRSRRSKKQPLWKMFGCANMRGGCGCNAGAPALMNGGGACSGSMLSYPYKNISCVNNLAYNGKGGRKNRGGNVNGNENENENENEKLQFNYYLNAPLIGGGTSGDNMPLGAKYPSGTVGSPWGPSYSSWPGTNGIQGDRNYYILNPYNNQPDYSPSIQERTTPAMSTGGSRKYKKSKKNKKMNTFRKHSHSRKYIGMNKRNKVGGLPTLGIMTDIKNTFNALRGNPQIVSPLPFNNQLNQSNNCSITKSGSGIVM